MHITYFPACGFQVEVEQLGLHGLCCNKSLGQHFRQAAVNRFSEKSLGAA